MSLSHSGLPSAEIERVFAVLRFVSQRQEASSSSLSSLSLPAAGGSEGDTLNAGTVAAVARGKAGKKVSDPLIIPEDVQNKLEAFRMAVTNIPVQMETVQSARAALRTALRDAYPNKLEDVDQLCDRNLFVSKATAKGTPHFMLRDVYGLQAMHEVVPGLYVGSYHPASERELLHRHKVTHVLCCIDVMPRFPSEFTYMKVSAQDMPGYNIAKFFPQTFEFIEDALIKQHSAVLVHCGAGISRAPTIAAAYLIKKLRLTAVAAIELIQSRRHVASPNLGFRQQLRAYQEELGIYPEGAEGARPRAGMSLRINNK
ncbi:putative dual specificity protein phosphatase [Trypanosoma cruzi]|uniref:Dual specificity protein phosphatase, putative n=2 Tax=Trypanosoma cruzi TaxID=5693 RepID=Q4DT47_TRYCC|nr:dual specificity protein phosphatase, putative [Trypanosoma cruzi]EAN95709.1 dual specificity protein phosphatase, putative [Trypanosoma cruzi]PWV08589.1 putative dual specificity protein phosphatase [Trypanosoma cruzi]RNC57260.1 dual specificity protein phosphatase [Trypanosoma cruzi]|eukprot:XP_817560.1 dual specificity protein phosphatase [Trypanosoma cruzi strain CL Brener]